MVEHRPEAHAQQQGQVGAALKGQQQRHGHQETGLQQGFARIKGKGGPGRGLAAVVVALVHPGVQEPVVQQAMHPVEEAVLEQQHPRETQGCQPPGPPGAIDQPGEALAIGLDHQGSAQGKHPAGTQGQADVVARGPAGWWAVVGRSCCGEHPGQAGEQQGAGQKNGVEDRREPDQRREHQHGASISVAIQLRGDRSEGWSKARDGSRSGPRSMASPDPPIVMVAIRPRGKGWPSSADRRHSRLSLRPRRAPLCSVPLLCWGSTAPEGLERGRGP